MADMSGTTVHDEQANHDKRWPRLVATFLWSAIWFGLGLFLVECVWHLWKHNFSIDSLTVYSVLFSLAKALGFGLFCGFFVGFGTWLSQELFGRTKSS